MLVNKFVAAAFVAGLSAGSAQAAVNLVTKDYSFVASNFARNFGPNAPSLFSEIAGTVRINYAAGSDVIQSATATISSVKNGSGITANPALVGQVNFWHDTNLDRLSMYAGPSSLVLDGALDFNLVFNVPTVSTPAYFYMTYANGTGTSWRSFSGALTPMPELASWAMMFGGFGLLGAVMRRGRKVAGSLS